MEEDLITFEEAAGIAKVSPYTIKYWVKTGRLESFSRKSLRTGRPWGQRVRRQDLVDSLVHKKLQRQEELIGSKLLSTQEVASEFGMTYNQVRRMARLMKLTKYQPYADRTSYYSYNEIREKMEEDPNYYIYAAPHKLRLKRLACGCIHCYN